VGQISPQRTWLALSALELPGIALRRYDAKRQRYTWRGAAPDRRSSVASPIRTFYTVKEAAVVTGGSEKSIRRRIERRTLPSYREGHRVILTHGALQKAGLVDDRVRESVTSGGIEQLAVELRRRPEDWVPEDVLVSRLKRSDRLVVLLAWRSAGLVEQSSDGHCWRWMSSDR
jgi:hypothetical protein